jgi:hypothetical protein
VSALLVGQAPSRTCPRPFECDSGRRLARYVGTDLDDLLSVFKPRNLIGRYPGALGKYDRFSMEEGRASAAHMRRYVLPRYDVALVCGVATARCFGWDVLDVTAVGRCLVYTLPHPAGTSMWWNDPENRLRGSIHARMAVAAARRFA